MPCRGQLRTCVIPTAFGERMHVHSRARSPPRFIICRLFLFEPWTFALVHLGVPSSEPRLTIGCLSLGAKLN